MELAPHRISEPADTRKQHSHGLHRGEASYPSSHRAQHSVFCASVAILGIKGIADKAAVARLVGQVSGEGSDLSLEPAYSGRKKWGALGNARVRHSEPGGEIVGAINY